MSHRTPSSAHPLLGQPVPDTNPRAPAHPDPAAGGPRVLASRTLLETLLTHRASPPPRPLTDAHLHLRSHLEVPLFGHLRLEEGLIQVLALTQLPGMSPVGWVVLSANARLEALATASAASSPSMPVSTSTASTLNASAAAPNATPAMADELEPPTLQPVCQDPELRLVPTPDGAWQAWLNVRGTLRQIPLETFAPLEWRARNQGLEPVGLPQRSVAFIGLGSVGAALAIDLARAGLTRFVLLDPDRLSIQNLSRHPGDLHDLGRLKTTLLEHRLLARCPHIQVTSPDVDVCEPAHGPDLRTLLRETDLLIVSTDEPVANLAANRLALELALPALFVGVYEGGIGGEIFVQRPEWPGCYACVAAFRATLPRVPRAQRAHDYVQLRPGAELPALHALAIDIGHVNTIAASIALGLLGDAPRLKGLVSREQPLLLVGNGRAEWLFQRPFEVISARIEPGCPACEPQRAHCETALEHLMDSDFSLQAEGATP